MEFVDKAFARRLEATEEVPQVHHARLYQKLYPEVNAAAEEICGVLSGLVSMAQSPLLISIVWSSSIAPVERLRRLMSVL